jgi:excisionase family DNA binding protein
MPRSRKPPLRLAAPDLMADEDRRRRELCSEGVLSVAKAAEFIAVGRTFLYHEMGAGRLPFLRVGRKRCIPRVALVAYCAERLKNSSDPPEARALGWRSPGRQEGRTKKW